MAPLPVRPVFGVPRREGEGEAASGGLYRAKAAEQGVGVNTVRRWVMHAKGRWVMHAKDSPARERSVRGTASRADPRWLDAAQQVIARHVTKSRPVRRLLLTEIGEEFGSSTVAAWSGADPDGGIRAAVEAGPGANAFTGNTKGKRSIANRPQSTYGRLLAIRPASSWWTPTGWMRSRWSR